MKKLLLNTTILLMMLSMVSLNASAYDLEVNGIYYNITSSVQKTVEVTYLKGSAYSGSVVIPNYVTCDGVTYSVTGIGYAAFYGCSGLTLVVIPNSVTTIGDYAFGGCRSLTSVTIPNSVTSIGTGAFSNCSGLSSITIPNYVTSIGNFAFSGCSGLTSAVYNSTQFFYLPTSLNGDYSIPEGIKEICTCAFFECYGLTSVVIPNSVTAIGALAFESCI